MSNQKALRLYFRYDAKVKKTSFWQKVLAPSLGSHLAALAKKDGIGQVLIYRIDGGYLKGEKLSFDTSEITPGSLPQCIELIDDEDKLLAFARAHKSDLAEVRTVLLSAEESLAV